MDPVTTAILAAIAAGVPKVIEQAAADAYDALKAVLRRKFGDQSDVIKATKDLESKPDSAGRQATLHEEVTAAKADQDPEVLAAARALLERIKAQPGGEQFVQTAIGSYIAQAGPHAKASVRVNQPKE
jgi:phage terminase small subunit